MRAETLQDYKKRILRVLVFIQENLDRELSLHELADLAHYSPYHFHRIFRGMVGESLAAHIRRIKLERAASRLKFTSQQVIEIAFDAGYETHEAFTRAFRTMTGQSPSAFHARLVHLPVDRAPSGVHYGGGKPSYFTPFDS